MTRDTPASGGRASEERLDRLREEALRAGRIEAPGIRATGGPAPEAPRPGYYGRPVLKPPVWTWEIPLYFFVGGLAGMAAVLALGAALPDPGAALRGIGPRGAVVWTALWLALGGAVLSPILLVLDLGRPRRFLNMLRVFKWRSPMSVGAWILSAFGGVVMAAVAGCALLRAGLGGVGLETLAATAVTGAAVLGALLATYTGVLIGATAIPAWNAHRATLPLHFGIAGLGAAAATLELLGHRLPALGALGFLAAGAETLVGASIELRRHGAADRALRAGRAGLTLRVAGALAGPLPLALRLLGLVPWAAGAFLVGGLLWR